MSGGPFPRLVKPADNPAARSWRIFGVVAVIIGLPMVLIMAAVAYIAHSIRYPGFLDSPAGENVAGAHVPERSDQPYAEIRAALGVVPDDFRAKPVGDAAGLGTIAMPATGWFVAGAERKAVVIVPAAGGTAGQLIAYIKFLHDAGYATAALNSPANGHLGTDWGWSERKLLTSAAYRLREMGFEKIAVLGISEGAAAAIMSQSLQPNFTAIVADSSYANLASMIHRSPSFAALNPALAHTVMWFARKWYGMPIDAMSPVDAAAHIDHVPLLLIQNRGDRITTVADAEEIAKSAGGNAEVWITPSEGHGDAVFDDPQAYAARVTAFLKKNL